MWTERGWEDSCTGAAYIWQHYQEYGMRFILLVPKYILYCVTIQNVSVLFICPFGFPECKTHGLTKI